MRIGVFVCHCGSNIAGTVDCAKVAELARILGGLTLIIIKVRRNGDDNPINCFA